MTSIAPRPSNSSPGALPSPPMSTLKRAAKAIGATRLAAEGFSTMRMPAESRTVGVCAASGGVRRARRSREGEPEVQPVRKLRPRVRWVRTAARQAATGGHG